MPRKRKLERPSAWTRALDDADVSAALEDATVDAYGESEEHSGLLTLIEDELQFPFRARILGEEVSIVGMEWPDDDSFGLNLICETGRKKYLVEARSFKLIAPFPKGHLYLAAYLEWKSRL